MTAKKNGNNKVYEGLEHPTSSSELTCPPTRPSKHYVYDWINHKVIIQHFNYSGNLAKPCNNEWGNAYTDIVLGLLGMLSSQWENTCFYVCIASLLKKSQSKFVHKTALVLAMSDAQASTQKWLDNMYRTAHPALCWLHTRLAEWIGENL